jgi:signal transduction histidine kinase
MKAGTSRFSFNRLSIQQRLPLLICALLLSAIVIFSFATYYGLKKATLKIGKERLHSLTDQLSSMLGQSAQALLGTVRATANQNFVKQYLKSEGKEARLETLQTLDKLNRDSTWVSVELLDSNKILALRSDKSTVNIKVHITDVLYFTRVGPGACKIGKIYNVKGSMYYPTIATVADNNQIMGYIICWQILKNTPKAVNQLSQLMGTGATLYIGNTDGSLWTNMIRPVKGPPVRMNHIRDFIEYDSPGGQRVIATAQLIANTNWLVLVDFSEETMLAGTTSFVNWIIIVGVVLTAIGILGAWVMSYNITRPLNQLTDAATAISTGDFSYAVNVYRNDELGQLANAFNIMAEQVHVMQQELEDKVKERTAQLENVNKELEAFSYSVSHDLRTPLRAISGYSTMLKEDYDGKLDAEADRIIHNIITNAKMMGQLIDDLLAFSRLSKKELVRTHVDMQLLATTVVDELLQNNPKKKYRVNIDVLPPAYADQGMIKQALINLVNNAIKYSSKKADPNIEIGFKDEDSNTIYYIKDNGVGFDMAYAGKLFGVFQRLHSQEEFEGTGVGLALVKRIIDKHNGEIWAEALENRGATFYFSLPKNIDHE